MRWLLFLLAFSANAECVNQTLYSSGVGDPILRAVIDDGSLYVSRPAAHGIERVNLVTGQITSVYAAAPDAWDVQHGFLATPETISRPAELVKTIRVRDGYIYWAETDGVLRRRMIAGAAVEAIAALDPRRPNFEIFKGRAVFINGGSLYWKPVAGGETTFMALSGSIGNIGTITDESILVTTYQVPSDATGWGAIAHLTVMRTSWDGQTVSTDYETTFGTYHQGLEAVAYTAGETEYIILRHSHSYSLPETTVLIRRAGVLFTSFDFRGGADVLNYDSATITLVGWPFSLSSDVMRFCASSPHQRALR